MSGYERHKWVTDQCPTGKRGYSERVGAKEILKSMTKAGRGSGLHVYCCAECQSWHIGHMPGAVRRGEVSADEWYGR